MSIQTMEDLFNRQLQELYDGEQREVDALPKLSKASSSARLREALEEHLRQTRTHVERLEDCFRQTGRSPHDVKANGIQGLIEESERVIDDIAQSPLRDAALIGAARRVEHYEIAAYSEASSVARLLGNETAARLLELTLDDERAADRKLSDVAETTHQEALQLGAHQRG